MAKKKKPMPEYDSEREARVLLEQMNKSIGLIAEQHGETNKNINEIKSELETVKMAVMENSANIKAIKFKLDTNITNHDKRITRLEEKVGI